MGSEFKFYDYKDGDYNPVWEWLNGQDKKVKAKFNGRIFELEATPPSQGLWLRPYADSLHAPCDGLIEIRAKRQRVEYRLIGFHHGPGHAREFVLVAGAIEQENRFVPRSTCERAQRRKQQVINAPDTFRVLHDIT